MSCLKRVHNNSINILSGFRIIVNSAVVGSNILLIFKNANISYLRYSAVFENGFHKKPFYLHRRVLNEFEGSRLFNHDLFCCRTLCCVNSHQINT